MKLKNDMLCAVTALLCFLLFSCESTPAVTDDDVTLDATSEVTIPVAEIASESPETDDESDMINGDDESNLTDEILVDTTFAEPELVIIENSNNKIDTNSDDAALPSSTSKEPDTAVSQPSKAVPSEVSSANTDIKSSVSEVDKKADDNKQSDAEPTPVGSILEYEPEVGALSRKSVPDTKEPSRTVTAFVGTLLEIRYPGKGWVFLGDSAQSRTIVYRTKKIDNGDTVFVFMPQTEGTALLSFFRYDALKDTYEDDVVNVVISAADSADARIMAPPYTPESPVPAPAKPNVTQQTPEASLSEPERSDVADDEPSFVLGDSVQEEPTNKAPTAIVPDPALDTLSAAELITVMENALKAGEPTRVIEAALVYARDFSDNLDYVRYMTGKAYELAGDTRDMKKAIECYESVVSAFPYSKYWQPSSDRIKYIRRFFFTIR